eukprot:TRINITY_DN28397_c0_g1_i2.p1 TRINITY_DN28397_c0_g1~~TRINITY_DN28397_c0_g1_i2.p1  ORF type:complete len:419 (+),score=81.16 TRINITY_DN28397_c0_g1_i2:416-1672(+)
MTDMCNDRHVYKNSVNEADIKYMYFHNGGNVWCIGPAVGGDQFYTCSKSAELVPSDAKWDFPVEDARVPLESGGRGETFVDAEFPAEAKSIGCNVGPVEWIRGTELTGCKPALYNKIEPSDVLQGALGDCWLLASIAALAEFPNYIKENILVEKDVTDDGKYTVRLYDMGSTSWKDIVIDDLIPCHPRQWCDSCSVPCFSQPHDNELYILLIEKAFAKYAGSYALLSGGCESVAWQVLTGAEEQLCWDRDGNGQWSKAVLHNGPRKEKPNDFQNGQWICTSESKDDTAMFTYLSDCDDSNYLIGAAIPGQTLEKARTDGLVEMHAYSVISAKEIHGVKLLRLRNPWGCQEWNGAWSDESSEWAAHPDIAKVALRGEAPKKDGVFWITWDDLRIRMTRIFVSPKDVGSRRGSHQECAAP